MRRVGHSGWRRWIEAGSPRSLRSAALRRLLPGHEAKHTSRLGWGDLANGRLLTAAEEAGFNVLVTIDQDPRYEQNMEGRRLAIVLLQSPRNDIPTLTPMAGLVMVALERIESGTVMTVAHPCPPRKGER